MKLKFKKLVPQATLPSYAKPGDAGLDLTVTFIEHVPSTGLIKYGTGLAVEIPAGYVGLLFPRSSVCKTDLSLTNSVGVIDSGYRGEIKAVFRIHGSPFSSMDGPTTYNLGDRALQMIVIPYPTFEIEEAQELSQTERGADGFGSSGR